jgi:hypothetical protein
MHHNLGCLQKKAMKITEKVEVLSFSEWILYAQLHHEPKGDIREPKMCLFYLEYCGKYMHATTWHFGRACFLLFILVETIKTWGQIRTRVGHKMCAKYPSEVSILYVLHSYKYSESCIKMHTQPRRDAVQQRLIHLFCECAVDIVKTSG